MKWIVLLVMLFMIGGCGDDTDTASDAAPVVDAGDQDTEPKWDGDAEDAGVADDAEGQDLPLDDAAEDDAEPDATTADQAIGGDS